MQPVHSTAAVLSVGDELTLGQTLDTNSRWVADRLASLGVITIEHATVPDDRAAQAAAIARLADACDLLVITGGLGPTADDLTRHALADAARDELVEDPIALAQVESWFVARSRAMPAINRIQAMRPRRSTSLPNLNGTAPGIFATIERRGGACDVFCLPGPPREMIPMFEGQLVPRLRPAPGRTVRTRVLHTFGLGESDLATRLGPLMDRARQPLVGTTASGGVVSVRIRYEGPLSPAEAEDSLNETEQLVRAAAGPYLFGAHAQTLPEVLLALLREKSHSLGVVESCTGGMLGALITDVPGSSSSFVGGLLTYANEAKERLAAVPRTVLEAHGAVSPQCAAAMAAGGLARLGASHCLAVTGIAGPGGAVPAQNGRPGKPVGTVFIARASADGSSEVRRFQMNGDRHSIRDWSAKAALAALRLHLIGAHGVRMLREVDVSAE